MKTRPKLVQVTPESKIKMDMERTPEERIRMLLQLIRYSGAVAEAGNIYRKSK